jgi:hypothetical protein
MEIKCIAFRIDKKKDFKKSLKMTWTVSHADLEFDKY